MEHIYENNKKHEYHFTELEILAKDHKLTVKEITNIRTKKKCSQQ